MYGYKEIMGDRKFNESKNFIYNKESEDAYLSIALSVIDSR